MRGTLVGLFVTLALAVSPDSRADDPWVVIGRVGPFFPRLSQPDDLLVERTRTLGLQKSDWDGVLGGVEVAVRATDLLELGQHFDAHQAVIDRAPDSVSDASSLLSETVVFGLTARLIPARTGVRFAPYLAAGPDLVFWRYVETIGDSSVRKANGTALGFHAAAGLRVFVTRSFALSAEYRWQFADADMNGEFAGRHIDFTGSMVTLGLTYRF